MFTIDKLIAALIKQVSVIFLYDARFWSWRAVFHVRPFPRILPSHSLSLGRVSCVMVMVKVGLKVGFYRTNDGDRDQLD